MDKLQPIIRHHFWILFLAALVLPPIAWSMTTGALDEQTQSRVDDLDKTLSGVAQGTGAPNGDWTTAATQLVNVRKESNRRAWNRLWDVQAELQIWPATVRPYMENCPYRGTPADLPNVSPTDAARVMATVPNLFRDDYEREIQRVWRIPEPVDEQAGLKADMDAPQKVLFPSTVMPRVPQAKWMAAQPTWKEMWNAQEDLWLMSELLKAIQRVNAEATSIADSNVRQIRLVQLFGGERAAAGGSSSASSSSPGGSDSMMSPFGGMPRGRSGATSGGPAPAEFPLAEEYSVKDAPSGRGGGYSGMMGSSSAAEGSGGSSSSSSGSDPQADENRYIKQEWAYRTRGFKLQLTVHQMYVPALISELLKSEFPVEIIRFQQSALNPDRPGGNRAGTYPGNSFAASGGGLSGSGGYPGGSSPGSEGAFPGGSESFPGDSGSSASASPDGTEGFGGEGTDYNPYGDAAGAGAGGAAAAKNAVNSAIVAAALSDVDMFDLVVVGEIYLYNQPEASSEGAEAVADQTAGQEAVVDPNAGLAPAAGPAGTGLNNGFTQPGVNAAAGNPATLTGGVTEPGGNSPATLESNVIPGEAPAGGGSPVEAAPAVPGTTAVPANPEAAAPAGAAPATEAQPSASAPALNTQ